MLDLHVWGSAFGLPSMDADCIAIITYMHNSQASSTWRLIPSNDPSISPSNTLPALHHDGSWTVGYWPIVSHLTANAMGRDLDASLTPTQLADRAAYSAYLAAHAAPLIDLSLYVSAANWAAATRPAYSALLPFPLTWTVPPLIRAEAVKRVEHLGFAEMDSDFDPNGGLHLSTGREALPETLRRHLPAVKEKKTVQEEMTPEQACAIRLYGLTEDCLSVLNDFLTETQEDGPTLRFFEGVYPSSLDCLAFGYLALMRDAPVPRSFLKDWLEKKTPKLSQFVEDMKSSCLQQHGDLPWVKQELSALNIAARTLDSVARNIPSLGDEYGNEVRRRAEQGVKGVDGRMLMTAMSIIATGVAIGYGLHTYKAMQPFGARTQVWLAHRAGLKLSDYGDLGSMLGSAMGGYQQVPSTSYGGYSPRESHIVETDTEVD